ATPTNSGLLFLRLPPTVAALGGSYGSSLIIIRNECQIRPKAKTLAQLELEIALVPL
ncbi:13576_t:CDS:2, partial [Funneliformis geosporum]